jgi:hypothetical protein
MNIELENLIKQYNGNVKFNLDDDLEWDLGITGDDAFDLLLGYRDEFNVDISTFKFEEFFYDEGHNILLMFKRLTRRYKKKRLTPNDLLNGIENGKL